MLRKRAILPAVLLATGMLCLVGCIYIPTFSHGLNQHVVGPGREVLVGPFAPPSGEDPAKDPSIHHFRTGTTTRDAVLAALGKPSLVTPDGRSLLYGQERRDGYFVFPLCFFYTEPDDNGYFVRLNFNSAGILISSEQQRSRDPSTIDASMWYVTTHQAGVPFEWPPPLNNRLPGTQPPRVGP